MHSEAGSRPLPRPLHRPLHRRRDRCTEIDQMVGHTKNVED